MDVHLGDPDPYWQTDLAAGEVRLWEQTYTLRWKVHQAVAGLPRHVGYRPTAPAAFAKAAQ